MRFLQQSAQMYVQKCGYMSKIEQANVTQVDRLCQEHALRYHSQRNRVPGLPHRVPIVHSRDAKRSSFVLGKRLLQQREGKLRALEKPQRVFVRRVRPALDRTKFRGRKQRIRIHIGILVGYFNIYKLVGREAQNSLRARNADGLVCHRLEVPFMAS